MGNEKEWKMTEVFSFNDGINDDGFARRQISQVREDGGFIGQQREVGDIKVWNPEYSTVERQPDSYSISSFTTNYSFYIFNKYIADCVMVNKTDMLPIFMGFIIY